MTLTTSLLSLSVAILLSVCSYSFIRVLYYRSEVFSLKKRLDDLERNNISQVLEEDDRTSAILYYDYVRDEIKHEDDVTNQRLTWAITFQGFLIGAIGALIGFGWNGGDAVIALRKITLGVLPCVGIAFGLIAYNGIWASRTAIREVKEAWEKRNEIWHLYPHHVPQAFGQDRAFTGGTAYAVSIARLFIFIWIVILISEAMFISQIAWPQCSGKPDRLKCLLTDVGAIQQKTGTP